MTSIRFDIPRELEERLKRECGDLDRAAKEAFLVDLYRLGKLTHHQLATTLGLSRYDADGVLKRHNVTEDLPTIAEHRLEVERLVKLIGE